ncbi:MAG: S-layer homology domain-containing protein [Butyricicoccus sp.]|nr:S-layer homology domain-containing protein [Butyricicoccus sp.]
MKRKILSVVLCAAILSAALCTGVQAAGMGEFQKQRTYSGQFHDITGKWYETYIADLYEYGLAEGMSANTMAPKEPVTVAQIVALAARVNAKYYNGKIGEADGAWYDPYISYALDYGLITEEENQDVDRPATRGESALILSRTLPDWQFDRVSDSGSFSDIAADEPCLAAVTRLCRAGVITGYEDGTFRPEQGISRAEAMTIVDRIVNKSLRYGYNEWLQGQNTGGGKGDGSGDNQGSDPIGIGVGYGRATFLLQGIAMLTVDMENSSFTLAVYAGETGGMVTMTGVCEVKQDISGNILMSCVVSDRAAQGGASVEVALEAAALNALGFTYDGNRTITLTEAIKNGAAVSGTNAIVVGTLSIGATLTVAN